MFHLCTIMSETEVGREVIVWRNNLPISVVDLTCWFVSDKLYNSLLKLNTIYKMGSLVRLNK